MLLLFLPYVIQIGLILHAIRNGKNTTWIWLLVILPYVGGLLYFVLEVLPDLRRGRLVDPEAIVGLVYKKAAIKRLQDEIVISDTVANRVALADEYDRIGEHRLALEGYKKELAGLYANDRALQLKVAKSAFHLGDYPTAAEYFNLALSAKASTSTELLTWAAYANWQVSPTAENLAVIEGLFSTTKTTQTGRYLCQAYGKLGEQAKIERVLEVCRLQMTKLNGTARAQARFNVNAMSAELEALKKRV